jgi:hypothetical protein
MKKILIMAGICGLSIVAQAQNVGIGTNSPASKLDVNGTVNSAAGYYYNASGIAASAKASPMNVELSLNLPNTVASTIDIGNFSITNGAHAMNVYVTIANAGFSVTKMYNIPVAFNATAGAWLEVIPDASTGPYSGNDFALDISVSNNTASLRLRRTAGTTDGSTAGGTGARVRVQSQGSTTDAFTTTTATATGVTAPTTQYGYKGAVPVGGIILWSGATTTIPAGWQLCDGTNGTPDLRDRFVVGAGSTYAVAATGGSATHTHSTPALTVPSLSVPSLSVPSLSISGLSIPSLSLTGTTDQGTNNTNRVAAVNGCCSNYFSRDIHSHNVTGSTSTGTTGSGSTGTGSTGTGSTGTGTIAANTTGSGSSLPPYYALAYIMRRF